MKRRAFIAGFGRVAALVLLVTSQFEPAIAETSQQDQVFTATASASEGRAYNLCMVRGFFNITGVSCTCTQRGTAGAPDMGMRRHRDVQKIIHPPPAVGGA